VLNYLCQVSRLDSSFGFDAVGEPTSIIPKEDFFFYA